MRKYLWVLYLPLLPSNDVYDHHLYADGYRNNSASNFH
jgi:hypothetical protein